MGLILVLAAKTQQIYFKIPWPRSTSGVDRTLVFYAFI